MRKGTRPTVKPPLNSGTLGEYHETPSGLLIKGQPQRKSNLTYWECPHCTYKADNFNGEHLDTHMGYTA